MNIFLVLGFTFLALGVLGIVLPLLPATPFVLLAAACFARSSERWHRWMLASSTFGPMITNWEEKRCVSCKVKTIAIVSMVIVGGFSIFVAVESFAARVTGGVLIGIGLVVILLLKTCDNGDTGPA